MAPITFGYMLSSAEHGPSALVDNAARAEELGFAFATISDHFHPWIEAQGHSPFVWSTLGAIARATERVEVATAVTCPIVRMHPAVVAQAAATTSLLFGGRFSFGVGTGEALNEHIFGSRWPPARVRVDMLEEAVGLIRQLFTGDTVDHYGRYFRIENARLFDPPQTKVPICISGFGRQSAALAGRIGDGYWGTSPDRDLLDTFEMNGGAGPRYALVKLCWAPTEDEARATVHRLWPTSALGGQLSQDLPTWTHFEQATSMLTEEQTTARIPCGPRIAEELRHVVDTYAKAGYDHIAFQQAGDDQEAFFRFWNDELAAAVQGAGD
jgi:G6PDH family F420-dependent oxidoreductase